MDDPPPSAGGYRRRYSLRTSLAWLVALCVVPAAVVSAALIYVNYKLQHDKTYLETVLLARDISLGLEREFAVIESGLRVLATAPYLQTGDLISFHQRAREALRYQIVHNYTLTDQAGRQYLNTLLPFGDPLPPPPNGSRLQKIFETGEPLLTDLFEAPVAKAPMVAMGVPVFRGEAIIYSLNVGLAPERILAIVSRNPLPPGWLATVLDRSGTIVARTYEMNRFIGEKAVDALLQRLEEESEGTLEAETKEGIPVVSSFSRMDRYGWTVAVSAPKSTLEAGLMRLIGWLLAGVTTAFLLGLLIAARIGARVTSAVRELNDAALALGRGESVDFPHSLLQEADAVGLAMVKASQLMAQVSHLAHHDALTGLSNRVLFDEQVTRELAAAARSQQMVAVLAVDLDGFKTVNDQQGHAMGDQVLKVVAQRILAVIRASDTAARLGGDEFAVLLRDNDLAQARQTADRLVRALSEPYAGVRSAVSASIGIAVFPASGATADDLMEAADQALYEAKRQGKQRAVSLNPVA